MRFLFFHTHSHEKKFKTFYFPSKKKLKFFSLCPKTLMIKNEQWIPKYNVYIFIVSPQSNKRRIDTQKRGKMEDCTEHIRTYIVHTYIRNDIYTTAKLNLKIRRHFSKRNFRLQMFKKSKFFNFSTNCTNVDDFFSFILILQFCKAIFKMNENFVIKISNLPNFNC